SDLVAVTEDRARVGPGCDAISVFDLSSGNALHRGPTWSSPGRLAASSFFDIFFAPYCNGDAAIGGPGVIAPFATTVVHDTMPLDHWFDGTAVGDNYALLGAAAFVQGDRFLLYATQPSNNGYASGTGFRLAKVPVDHRTVRSNHIGP